MFLTLHTYINITSACFQRNGIQSSRNKGPFDTANLGKNPT